MKISFEREVNGHITTQVYTVENPCIPVYCGGKNDRELFVGMFSDMDKLIEFIEFNGGSNIKIERQGIKEG